MRDSSRDQKPISEDQSAMPPKPPLSKNQKVVHLLAKLCGNRLGRGRLTKALFLADYHSRRHLGHPITTYDYKFHHQGPWTAQIQEDVKGLEAVDVFKEHTYFGFKGIGHYYTAEGEVDYSDLSSSEMFVLEAVVDRCASGDLDDLLEEVYDTPPMRLAKATGRGVRIPMEMFDEEEREPVGVDLDTIKAAEHELDMGLGEDFHAVLNGLQTRYFSHR